MLAHILLDYKGSQMTHSASDDLESLVYVLIWMCILYAGPATLCEDKHVTETVLKSWVTVATDVDAMTLGALKTYIKSRPSTVTNKFTIYFQPVCSVVQKLLTELHHWSATDDIENHYQALRNILVEGFGTVKEVPNWSPAQDVHGYGLLHHKGKRLPPWVTEGYDSNEAGLPQPARRHHT